ncbi:hypothetical protein ASD05_24620 [Variovorax sp. Root434]|nr:hypothetical protein ASD05_24620 [Variovorax sp. Root434]
MKLRVASSSARRYDQEPSAFWVSVSALLVALQIVAPEALKKVRRKPSPLVMETAFGLAAGVAASAVVWLCAQALPNGPTERVASVPQVLR